MLRQKKRHVGLTAMLSIMVIVIACNQASVTKTSLENRYFRLDFEQNSYLLRDIESQFFMTFPHDDPTEGDVVYDRQQWENDEMLQIAQDGLYLFIKDRTTDDSFDSFRMTSKAYYNLNDDVEGILFVFKGRLPSAQGLWPAWWLNGGEQAPWVYRDEVAALTDAGLDAYTGTGAFYKTPSAVNTTDWPGSGEIDIIESINGEEFVHNTLHTCPQMCDSEWNDSGVIQNCANAKAGDPNAGCSGTAYRLESLDGTFACYWQKETISFYYWSPEEAVRESGGPLDLIPQPEHWGDVHLKNRVRLLETDCECEAQSHGDWQCESCRENTTCNFKNLKMIFNMTLCGKWAGSRFDSSETPLENCQTYIAGDGGKEISNQFITIEYVSVSGH